MPEALRALDRMQAAAVSRITGGLSPVGLSLAVMDWWMHLKMAPGKQMQLVQKALRKTARPGMHAAAVAGGAEAAPSIVPLPGDNLLRAEAWRQRPFSIWRRPFF